MSNKKDVEIRVFASRKEYARFDVRDEPQVAEIIRTQVLPKTEAEYHRVDVKIKRKKDQTPKYLVAYLLRKDIYLAEVVKVDVESDFQVTGTTWGYDESKEEEEEEEEGESKEWTAGATYGLVDFVAGTPVPEIPTALAAVTAVAQMATNAGLTSKVLLGPDASVANYKQYLQSGLQGFVNVGHGNTGGIVLSDGNLPAAWFQGLANKPLSPAVVYFNSCQVFNPPLQPAIMSAGARTYIGGKINLRIGPSEKVCKGFWNKVLSPPQVPMGTALSEAEIGYPDPGAHGISGDLGLFRAGHIIVSTHVDFRGPHRHIFGWEKNLNHPEDRTLNDKISSFVVVSGTWKFYKNVNFDVSLGGEYGPGVYRWVEAVGVSNDQISSLRCIKS